MPGCILRRMRIQAWKRFEKSDWFQRNKARLKQLTGKELKLEAEIDLDFVNDGDWRYDLSRLDEYSIVYSLGVGDTIDFDLGLIARCGASVHAFDPTPGSFETLDKAELPREFDFHAWAVAGEDGELTLYPRVGKSGNKSEMMYTLVSDGGSIKDAIVVPAFTLASIVAKLGHARIDLLKMDIEGAEYDVLDSMLETDIRPVQLLVEFHHRFPGIGVEATRMMIQRLEGVGYKIFAVSDIGREVSFVYMP